MSGCANGPTLIEEVRIRIIDLDARIPIKKEWQDCISAVSPLKEIFQRWVDEVHPGSDYIWYYFTLSSPDGHTLSGEEVKLLFM
uniref:Uncharacterized protein n=1 Tax=Kwoniella bestiolae CBS 10118 TaxID=1296100 RepID=A0A1B9G0V1_9TREE|nr:hypothetical protein I302_06104 [Kwoniella bestiolae CBS 10118]OCF24643.1 hypothetical protein I302_06104 [Kwoniella bestiolae CBS 10118]